MPRVLVVGAGLAGLCAADRLHSAGVETLVLEARGRVGGRTHTAPFGRGVFDLGGQWLGPLHTRLGALAARFGVRRFPTYNMGTRKLRLGDRVRGYEGDMPAANLAHLAELQLHLWRLERLAKRVSPADPLAADEGPAWDTQSVEAWKQSQVRSHAARALFDVSIRSVFSCEPAELSLLSLLAYANAGGGFQNLFGVRDGNQDSRFDGGAQQLSEGLARVLGERLQLADPVHRIEQLGGSVRVHAASGVHAGERVIVAVPPALVTRMEFSPALPSAAHDLRQRLTTGTTLKVLLLYERAFWRSRGEAGEAYSDTGPVVFTYDNSSRDGRQPALVAFVVGRAARELSLLSPEARREAVLDAVAKLHGTEARAVQQYVEHDWSQEHWSGGCPVALCGPGTYSAFASNLRQPVGLVHWAGTETAVEHTGFMEGALESGERAADEVLVALGKRAR